MIKILKIMVISFLTLSFAGCNLSDYTETLSGNYQFCGEGKGFNSIAGPHIIEANVTGYGYDKDFIIAEQVPNKEVYKINMASAIRNKNGRSEAETKEDLTRSLEQADSIINHDQSYKKIFSGQSFYWIIRHKDGTIFGPLTKEQYLFKRRELVIPSGLNIIEKDY
jgi:hypothetical protein